MKKLLQIISFVVTCFSFQIDASGVYVTNNYNATATNLQFFNATNTIGTIIPSLGYTDFLEIPLGATAVYCNYAINNYNLQAIYSSVSLSANTTLFGSGSLTNTSQSTWYVGYTNPNITMVSTILNYMPISPGQEIPILTGTTTINLYQSQIEGLNYPPVYTSLANVNPNTNYIITASNTIISTPLIINNSNTTATVYFNFTNPPQYSIAPGASLPLTAQTNNVATCQFPSGSVNIPYTTNSSINIFTNYVLTNNSSSDLYLTLYYNNSSTATTGNWQLNSYQSMLIPTGVTGISAQYSYQGASAFNYMPMTTAYSYQITDNGSWQVPSYTPTLYNNGSSNNSASNLNFYDQTNSFISGLSSPLDGGDTAPIPGNASYLTMYNGDLSCNLTFFIPFSQACFFQQNSSGQLYTITNNSGSTIYVNYFGTINTIPNVQLNSNPSIPNYLGIPVGPGSSIPIVNNATTSVSISSEQSGVTPISNTTLANGTSCNYYIYNTNGALEISTNSSSYFITNNYQTDANSVVINSSNGTSLPSGGTISGNSSTTMPFGAYSLTCNDLGCSNLLFPINSTGNASMFGSGGIYNTTSSPVNIFYSGTVNSVTNTPFNSSSNPIVIAPGTYIPIIAGTTTITGSVGSVQLTGFPATGNASANANYYIQNNNTVTTTPTLTNNSNTTATVNFNYANPSQNINVAPGGNYPLNTTNQGNNAVTCSFASGGYVNINYPQTSSGFNIFTNYIITNNSQTFLWLIPYEGSTPQPTGGLPLNPGQSMLIPYTITGWSAQVNYNDTTVIFPYIPTPEGYSYLISNTNGVWTIPAYTPTLTNNDMPYGSQTITNIYFYDANSSQISPSNLSLASQANMTIPSNATHTSMYNADLGCDLSLPILFPYQNIFTTQNIFNQTEQDIYVCYSGTVNGQTGQQFNYIPGNIGYPGITVAPGSSVPILTGALNVTINQLNGQTFTTLTQTALTANTDYYVYEDGVSFYIEPYQSTTTLTNNSTAAITNTLNYYDGSNPTTSNLINPSPESIPAGGYNALPNNASSAQFSQTILNTPTTVTIPVIGTSTKNQSIFTTNTITNNSSYDITINYYTTSGTTLNSTAIAMNPADVADIFTATSYFTVIYNGTIVTTSPTLVAGQNYDINYTGGSNPWNIDTYPADYTLSNSGYNNVQTLSTLNFYNQSSSTPINPTPYPQLPAGKSEPIPSTAFYATASTVINTTPTNITVPVYTSSSATTYGTTAMNSNVFATGSITNNSSGTLSVTYAGLIGINGGISSIPLNSTPISVMPDQSIPILTGASQIFISSTSGSQTPNPQNLMATTNYYVNDNGTQLSLNNATQPLTNNYSQPTGVVTFNVSSSTAPSSISSWKSTPIPLNATSASFTQSFNGNSSTLTIPVSSFTPSNIFENYVLYNNYNQNIYVTFYNGGTNSPLNTPITVPQGQWIPIIASPATWVGITSSSSGYSYGPTALGSTNTSYYVAAGSGALTLTSYTAQLNNNNTQNQNITNLQFLQSNGSSIKVNPAPTTPLTPGNSTTIPATATTASMNYLGVQWTIPVSLKPASNIFATDTNNNLLTLTNITNQSININFYQSNGSNLNSSSIALAASNYTQIPTSATSVTVSAGTVSAIQNPISSSYFIYQDTNTSPLEFSTTIPLSTAILTNNSNQTASGVSFKNINGYLLETGQSIPSNSSTGNSIAIPESATTGTFTQTFNSVPAALTTSVSDTAASNLFTPGFINNASFGSSTPTMYVYFYGLLNGQTTTLSALNQTGICMAPTSSNPVAIGINTSPIMTGAQQVMVTDTNGNILVSQQTIPNFIGSNYVYFDTTSTPNQWIISQTAPLPYNSIATLTNNSGVTANNLAFFGADNVQIGSTIASFPATPPVAMPTTATFITVTDLGTSWTLPVIGTTNSTLFNNNSITNNAQSLPATLTYSGTINGQAANLNAAISLAAGSSSLIPSGGGNTVSVYLAENDTTYALQANTPYYIDYIDSVWSLNPYTSSALLYNNFNSAISQLTFNNYTTPQYVSPNNGSVLVPTNSSSTSFTDFGVSFSNLPISSTSTSNLFSSSVINNRTNQLLGIKFLKNGTPFNATPATLGAGLSVNIFNGTTSLQIFNGNTMVLDTSTISGLNPLPLTQNYNIIYNSGIWSFEPIGPVLMNNFNQPASSIVFYTSSGSSSTISSPTQPYATVAAPADAVYAIITYPVGKFTAILQTASASSTSSSKVLTNSLLINNSDTDVTINFNGTISFNGATTTLSLNDTPIPLLAGDAIPFITGTNEVTIFDNGQPILDSKGINSNLFYEIQTTVTNRSLELKNKEQFRAPSSNIQTSSAGLGILRFLGGQDPTPPNMKSIYLYAQNASLFQQYLYVDTYVECITNSAAQKATRDSVQLILDTYAANYRNQPNFNYISYFYLINEQLSAAQARLVTQYAEYADQINQFFIYLQKRVTRLLA